MNVAELLDGLEGEIARRKKAAQAPEGGAIHASFERAMTDLESALGVTAGADAGPDDTIGRTMAQPANQHTASANGASRRKVAAPDISSDRGGTPGETFVDAGDYGTHAEAVAAQKEETRRKADRETDRKGIQLDSANFDLDDRKYSLAAKARRVAAARTLGEGVSPQIMANLMRLAEGAGMPDMGSPMGGEPPAVTQGKEDAAGADPAGDDAGLDPAAAAPPAPGSDVVNNLMEVIRQTDQEAAQMERDLAAKKEVSEQLKKAIPAAASGPDLGPKGASVPDRRKMKDDRSARERGVDRSRREDGAGRDRSPMKDQDVEAGGDDPASRGENRPASHSARTIPTTAAVRSRAELEKTAAESGIWGEVEQASQRLLDLASTFDLSEDDRRYLEKDLENLAAPALKGIEKLHQNWSEEDRPYEDEILSPLRHEGQRRNAGRPSAPPSTHPRTAAETAPEEVRNVAPETRTPADGAARSIPTVAATRPRVAAGDRTLPGGGKMPADRFSSAEPPDLPTKGGDLDDALARQARGSNEKPSDAAANLAEPGYETMREPGDYPLGNRRAARGAAPPARKVTAAEDELQPQGPVDFKRPSYSGPELGDQAPDEIDAGSTPSLESPATEQIVNDANRELDSRSRETMRGSSMAARTVAIFSPAEREWLKKECQAVDDAFDMLRTHAGQAKTALLQGDETIRPARARLAALKKCGDAIQSALEATAGDRAKIRNAVARVVKIGQTEAKNAKTDAWYLKVALREAHVAQQNSERIGPSFSLAVHELQSGLLAAEELPAKVAEYMAMPVATFETVARKVEEMGSRVRQASRSRTASRIPSFNADSVGQAPRDELEGMFSDSDR